MARILKTLLIAVCSAACAWPVYAQRSIDGPSEQTPVGLLDPPQKDSPVMPTETSLAVTLAFSSATWVDVGISTKAPSAEIAELLSREHYRLELIQMILLAKESGKKILDVKKRRADKDKPTVRKIAGEWNVDFDALYERSLKVKEQVEVLAAKVSRVRVEPIKK